MYLGQNIFSWKTGLDSKHMLLFQYWLYTYSLIRFIHVILIEIWFYCSHRDQVLLEDYHKPNPEQEPLINVRQRKTIQKSPKFLPQKIWGSGELHWMNGGHRQGNPLCWHNQVSSRTFKMSWATSRNNQIKVKQILQITCVKNWKIFVFRMWRFCSMCIMHSVADKINYRSLQLSIQFNAWDLVFKT